jgi:hypothetical protein
MKASSPESRRVLGRDIQNSKKEKFKDYGRSWGKRIFESLNLSFFQFMK